MKSYQHAITMEYQITSHGGIACTIVRLSDGGTQFLQGDDASNFMNEVDEVYLTQVDGDKADQIVNDMCSNYF